MESCMSRLLSHGMLSVQSWTYAFIHTYQYVIDYMVQSIPSKIYLNVVVIYFYVLKTAKMYLTLLAVMGTLEIGSTIIRTSMTKHGKGL